MTDYLTNLVARSTKPTPAIQPRLASLFEPLREAGPMFPKSGPLADPSEGFAVLEEGATGDLIPARSANRLENEPRKSSSPITESKVFDGPSQAQAIAEVSLRAQNQERGPVAITMKPARVELPQLVTEESSGQAEIEDASPRVRERERGPLAPTMKPTSAEFPKLEKIADGIITSGQMVPAEPSSQNANTQIVIPVVHLPSADEDLQRSANRLASVRRLRNQSSERRTSEVIEPRVENDSSTNVPADHADHNIQRERSGTLAAPRIGIEKIKADKYERRSIPRPASSVQGGNGFRSPPHALDSVTGSAARPVAEFDKQPAQTETLEPIINVTIGRVEVRAAQPTSQPKGRNSAASSKLMSLDDYLRQRAQGGKR